MSVVIPAPVFPAFQNLGLPAVVLPSIISIFPFPDVWSELGIKLAVFIRFGFVVKAKFPVVVVPEYGVFRSVYPEPLVTNPTPEPPSSKAPLTIKFWENREFVNRKIKCSRVNFFFIFGNNFFSSEI